MYFFTLYEKHNSLCHNVCLSFFEEHSFIGLEHFLISFDGLVVEY
jgi:hypothetical protein